MMYLTQERLYNMSRDVTDHGMTFDPPANLCSCGNVKDGDRTYCFTCMDIIDDGCALGQ